MSIRLLEKHGNYFMDVTNDQVRSHEEAIDFLLLKKQVDRVVCKRSDTDVPDSLGDQLRRISMKMYNAMGKLGDRSALIAEANKLLKQAELA